MSNTSPTSRYIDSPRHRTALLKAGPTNGPLMIFLHGWPELGLCWRAQMTHFAKRGWRCVAPDMRGYGGSSVPTKVADYAVREIVADMVELHDDLGGEPAVWVGHDHGSMIAWALAMHHADRCRAVISLTVPHFARGIGLSTLLPLVNREVYPVDQYPNGQWDYMLFYAEHFTRAVRDFEAHAGQLVRMLFNPTSADGVGKPAPLASIRSQGGWPLEAMGEMLPARAMLSEADEETMVEGVVRNGMSGACSWYLNDNANLAFAAEAPNHGRLVMPVLFLHADWDTVCDSAFGALAEPMREDVADLTEVRIAGGHMLMSEKPDDVNAAMATWLEARTSIVAPTNRR